MRTTRSSTCGRLWAAAALLAATSLSWVTAQGDGEQSVITSLKGRWRSTPWVLEMAEYLNTESPDTFWSFMDHLAETEDHTYKSQMEWANGQMSEGQIKLLQFSLSLRIESP